MVPVGPLRRSVLYVIGPVADAIAYEKIVLTPYQTRDKAVQGTSSNEPAD